MHVPISTHVVIERTLLDGLSFHGGLEGLAL